MKTKQYILLLASIFCLSLPAKAWDWWPVAVDHTASFKGDSLYYTLQLTGVASHGKFAPFWLQTNRQGDIAPSPYSGNLQVGILKPASQPHRWFDYDFALSLTQRWQSPSDAIHPALNRTATGYLNLAYAHARLYIVDITLGIQPEQYGCPDNDLTTGGLLYSRNAHPMPGVRIGIEQWTPFPGLYGYVEVKGGISHQWQADNAYVEKGYVHHKWIGGRIGGKLPVNLSYEFHHVAQWGGYSPVYGDLGNDLHAFLNAFFVRSGGSMANDQINAQGNHIGSQVLTLDVKGEGWKVSAYWQNIFEDGPINFIGFGMNLPDGLWGIHITQTHWRYISGFTYEFLQTTDQSGPYHDKDGFIYGGGDGYYRNSIYRNGWNYFYRTLGNPFLTSPVYNADGTISTQNSMVQAHFTGIKGDIFGFRYRLMGSHVRNYGNNNRSPQLQSTNTALLLEVQKHVEKAWGLDFSLSLAADIGNQFGNQFGAMLTIRKQGLITPW